MKKLLGLAIMVSLLVGCKKSCETHGHEYFSVCSCCFPKSTVVICIPCRETDNVEHCQPYCEECGSKRIIHMSPYELNQRKKKLGVSSF